MQRAYRLPTFTRLRRAVLAALTVSLTFTLAACGIFGADDSGALEQATTSTTATTPSTTVAPTTTTTSPPVPQTGGASLDDPLFPGLGNTGYDVLHYALDLTVTGDDLRAEATLTIVPDVPLTSFNLDLVGMTVDSVFVNNTAATTSRSGRELIITPSSTLINGAESTVRVLYRGTPEPIDDPSGPIGLGWHAEDWGTFVASEPLGAATWFPSNDHPTDKATFTISVTVPIGQVAAGPGLLVSETSTAGSTTFVWEMTDPMAPYLASVVTGDFTIFTTESANGVLIRNVLPTERASQLVPALAKTAEMIEEFSELFGPYPYDSYGVVAVPQPLGFALENQTLSLFDTNFLSLRRRTVENVLAHELAHQWFGNSVSPATWSDIWLSEGFASWADHYWTEQDGGITFDERAAFAAERTLRPPTVVRPDTMFDSTVYLRGALTLEALRRTVGDDVFFATLRTWLIRYGDTTASTDDFLLLVQQQSGQKVEDLVRSWLFDPEIPTLPPPFS